MNQADMKGVEKLGQASNNFKSCVETSDLVRTLQGFAFASLFFFAYIHQGVIMIFLPSIL